MLTPEKRVAVEGGLRRGNLALGPPESRAFTPSGGILRVLPQVPDMEPSYDRRSFVAWLCSLPLVGRTLSPLPAAPPPVTIDATPTPLYQQPDGRRNLVRITVTGLEAPAARTRVTDRRGALVGTAGILPLSGSTGTATAFAGEVWVPLSEPSEVQIELEVGKQRVVWPAGMFARERGLGCLSAQIADVPGQHLTFPTVLAASDVRYLASGPNPERAVPLLPEAEATRVGLTGQWTTYPQLYWWEGPD